MGGGGGGKTTTETQASYPPEFRPLAKSAVEQIQALQQAMPLVMFSDYQPAGTAGLAPLQQYAIDELVPATMRPNAGLQGALQTPDAVGAAARGVTGAAEPTQAANAALSTLSSRLAGPAGVLPSAQGLRQDFAARQPGNYNLDSIFPGAAPPGATSSMPTPILGGPGVTEVTPTDSGVFPDPYAARRPPVNQEAQILGLQLNDPEKRLFNGYIAQGLDPREAFRLVMDKRVRELSRLAPLPAPPEGPYNTPVAL